MDRTHRTRSSKRKCERGIRVLLESIVTSPIWQLPNVGTTYLTRIVSLLRGRRLDCREKIGRLRASARNQAPHWDEV